MRILPRTRLRHRRRLRSIQFVLSLAVAVAVFALVVPKITSYSSVWATLARLTWAEIGILVVASVFNLFTYWFQMMAAMPRLSLSQAAVNNQSSTTVANVVPGGGAVAIGVTYAMFRSWGFSGSEIALTISTTGIWNSFMKLLLPVLALALLAATGEATSSLLPPALVGLVILMGCLVVFAAMLWKAEVSRSAGDLAVRVCSAIRRALRRSPVTGFGDALVRFRSETLVLLSKRWLALTLTTVVSHLGLYLVLLLALRYVGVREQELGSLEVLAVFALARLLSAAPITPGGVGVVELALIGGLYAAGRHSADVPLAVFNAQVTAAALLFRGLTFGLQIPIGGVACLIWQRKKTWRRPMLAEAEPVAVMQRA